MIDNKDLKMYDELNRIVDSAKSGEISYEVAFNQIFELFDIVGCFSVDDIEQVYDMGRSAGKKKNALNSKDVGAAFLRAYKWCRDLRFE
jgi:hypothetical protein